MIEFLSGVVTAGYLVAAGFFWRFFRKTRDRLFAAFTAAFILFALNQALLGLFQVSTEPESLVYVLRILGFVAILAAILDKNVRPSR
jgi:heme A synthase